MTTPKPEDDHDGPDPPPDQRVLVRHAVGDALSRRGFGEVQVLSHDAADRALTPTRREIVETLAEREVVSVRDLAGVLDRDPGNVSRDLDVLVAENVVTFVKEGRTKRPELVHDTMIVEPLLADVDVSAED